MGLTSCVVLGVGGWSRLSYACLLVRVCWWRWFVCLVVLVAVCGPAEPALALGGRQCERMGAGVGGGGAGGLCVGCLVGVVWCGCTC